MNVAAATSGQFLGLVGSIWQGVTISTGVGASTLNDLTDVSTTGNIQANMWLGYNGANWVQSYFDTTNLQNVSGHGLVDQDHSLVYFPAVNKYISTHVLAAPSGLRTTDSATQMSGNTDILQSLLNKSDNLIYIPSGTYRVKPLYMRGNNTKLIGQGTLLVQTGYADNAILTISGSNCLVEGITLDGNRAGFSAAVGRGEGIRIAGNYNTVRNVTVLNTPTGGSANSIAVVFGNNNLVQDCYVSGAGFAAYYCNGDYNTFKDNFATNYRAKGFTFNGGPYNQLTVDGFYANQAASVFQTTGGGASFQIDPGPSPARIREVVVKNIFVTNGTSDGASAKFAQIDNLLLEKCTFYPNDTGSSTQLQIAEGINNLTIKNSWIASYLDFDAPVGDVTIQDTRFGEYPGSFVGRGGSGWNPTACIFDLQSSGYVKILNCELFGYDGRGIDIDNPSADSDSIAGYQQIWIENCHFMPSGAGTVRDIAFTSNGAIDWSRRFGYFRNRRTVYGGGTAQTVVSTWQPVITPLNYGLTQYAGTAAPTSTSISFRVGDEIIYTGAISSGQNLGWRCIASGAPGTWAEFGIIGNVGVPKYAFDITRFGAVGTNTGINNTGAIAAAIAAAIASGGPQTVFFPPGTYMVQDPGTGSYAGINGGLITIPTGASDITLYGPDATLLVGPNGGSESVVRIYGNRCKVIGLTRNLNANYSGDPSYRKNKDNTGFEINGTLGGGQDCSIIECKSINGYGNNDAITQGTSDFIIINGARCDITKSKSFDGGWNAFRIDGDQITVADCVGSGFRGNGLRINDGDIAFVRNNTLTSTRNHGRAGILSDAGSSTSFDASGLPARRNYLYLDNNYVYINPNGAGLSTSASPEGAGVALKLGSMDFVSVKGGYYGAGSATNNTAIRLEDVIGDTVIDGVRIDPQIAFTATNNTDSSIYHGLIKSISGSISGFCQMTLSGTTALQVSKSLYVMGSKIDSFNVEHVVKSITGSGANVITSIPFPLTNSTGSLTISVASKVFTVSSGQPFAIGARLRAYNTGNPAQYMEGFITAHDVTGTMTLGVDTTNGTGTYPVWGFASIDQKTFGRSGLDKVKIRNCTFGGPTFSTAGDNNEGPMIESASCRVLDIEGCKFFQGGQATNSYAAIGWNCNSDWGFDLIRIVNNDFILNTDKISSHVGRMIDPITNLATGTLILSGKSIAYNNRIMNIGAGGEVIANSANANYNRQILFSTDGECPTRFRWTTPPNTADSNTIFNPGDVIIQTVEGQPGNYTWLCHTSGDASNFILRDAPYKYIAISSGNTYTSGTAESGITPSGSAGIGSLQFGANRALTVGEAFTTKAGGVFSCTGSPVPTLTIRAKLGNVGDAGEKDLATISISSTGSNLRWKYDLRGVVKSVGAVGTLKIMGTTAYETGVNLWVESGIVLDLGAVNTSNTSHQRRVSVSAQYSVAATGNIVTCSQFEVMPW